MPTQEFHDPETEERLCRLDWEFGFSEMFLHADSHVFRLHSAQELRTTGVTIPVGKHSFFVCLTDGRRSEYFQVSVDGVPLKPEAVDYASADSPVHPAVQARPLTTHRNAPAKARWVLQARIESARQWSRVYALIAALLAVGIRSWTPASFADHQQGIFAVFVALAVVFVLADLASTSDRGAQVTMWLPAIAMGPVIIGIVYGYLLYWDFDVPLLSPGTFGVPISVGACLYFGAKALNAAVAGGALSGERREHA